MFEHPINRSLHRPRLFMGVEAVPAMVLVFPTVTAGVITAIHGGDPVVGGILIGIAALLYVILKVIARKDPYAFAIFWTSLRMQKVYEPRPDATQRK